MEKLECGRSGFVPYQERTFCPLHAPAGTGRPMDDATMERWTERYCTRCGIEHAVGACATTTPAGPADVRRELDPGVSS